MITASERMKALNDEIQLIRSLLTQEESFWNGARRDWMLEQGWCPDCDSETAYNGRSCATCNGQGKPGPSFHYETKNMFPAHKAYCDLLARKAPLVHETRRIHFAMESPEGKRCLLLCKSLVVDSKRRRLQPGTLALCVRRHHHQVHVQIDGVGESFVAARDVDLIEW